MLYLITQQKFINRGVYIGPYLPVYGFGGVILCNLLQHNLMLNCHKKVVKVFVVSLSVCTVLEYATSVLLEYVWGKRWWDYSDRFLSLQGRVCLMGAVAFGIGGILLVCVYLPLYEKCYQRCPPRLRQILAVTLILLFVVDAAYCAIHPNAGPGITQ